MNALRNSLVIVLAAAIPAALVAQAIGSPLFSETAVEATFAAFVSAAVIVIAFTDYAYRRPRDIFVSTTTAVRAEIPRPVRRAQIRVSCRPVASLTGSC